MCICSSPSLLREKVAMVQFCRYILLMRFPADMIYFNSSQTYIMHHLLHAIGFSKKA